MDRSGFFILTLPHLWRCKVFYRFGQAKFGYGGSISGSNQFTLLPQPPLKMMLDLKVVKKGLGNNHLTSLI